MPLSTEILRNYLKETASIELDGEAVERLVGACATATAALSVAASDSLFDTEPEQLHSVLNELADGAKP
jgi:pentose-5-phosphate-3-epimerase